MHNLLHIENTCGTRKDPWVNAVVEIPMGSRVKYEIDKDSGSFVRVDRILEGVITYPYNYGFVPRTICADGDALDIVILGSMPVTSLSVMRVRPIGVIPMLDSRLMDDKIVGVHVDDPDWGWYTSVEDLVYQVTGLVHFFKSYKRHGSVVVNETKGPEDAWKIINTAREHYTNLSRRSS